MTEGLYKGLQGEKVACAVWQSWGKSKCKAGKTSKTSKPVGPEKNCVDGYCSIRSAGQCGYCSVMDVTVVDDIAVDP